MGQTLLKKKTAENYKNGTLLVRNFEQDMLGFDNIEETEIKSLIDVSQNVKGAVFENDFRVVHAKPEGFTTIATRALKSGEKTPLYNTFSDVGLIYNGSDNTNLKYILTSSSDVNSIYKETEAGKYSNLSFFAITNNPELNQIQKIESPEKMPGFRANFDLKKLNKEELDANARSARDKMWEIREKEPSPGKENEIIITSNTKPIIGIIISNDRKADEKEGPFSNANNLLALAVKNYLDERGVKNLPIYHYNVHAPETEMLKSYEPTKEQVVKLIESGSANNITNPEPLYQAALASFDKTPGKPGFRDGR